MALEDLDWLWLGLIKDVPVIDGGLCNETQCCFAEPLPEHNILVHGCRLELRLLAEIEYLEGPRLCLEGNDLLCPVHDCTIGLDWASRDIVALLQVDDDNFRLCGIVLLLPNADEAVGLERLEGKG